MQPIPPVSYEEFSKLRTDWQRLQRVISEVVAIVFDDNRAAQNAIDQLQEFLGQNVADYVYSEEEAE